MSGAASGARGLSARRIIGFACNQAFIFALLFMGQAAGNGSQSGFPHFSMISLLLFMVLGFALVQLMGPAWFPRLLARPLLYVYAVVAAAGSLIMLVVPDAGAVAVVVQGLLVGVPCALLVTAWGRSFGLKPTTVSVPEVFLGSLVAALVCLVFSFDADSGVVFLAVRILPLAGVVNIEVSTDGESADSTEVEGGISTAVAFAKSAVSASAETGGRLLSAKILSGTFLFGMAAGVMLLYHVGPEQPTVPYFPMSAVLYGAFLIGCLSLLLSDGFGRGAALNKSYRLAVFIMTVGFLLVPWPLLSESALPGEAVVLAGYLGLQAVFLSLFLVLAELTGTDCAVSFSAGFLALLAGGLVGALVQEGFAALALDEAWSYGMVVLSGAITLLSYVFLFTERDFDQLSQLVSESDAFETVCATIAERYALSNRESEILAYALRGRTSERIAQELVISKSTVDTHLRRIYAKCGVHSRQELLDLANL